MLLKKQDMPYQPPIKIKEIKKTGVLDEKRFYKLLAERCNYVDDETVKMFYLALVKTISAELRQNGMVRLPHVGDFALIKQKDKLGLVGRSQRMVRGSYMLKFYAKRNFSDYFKKIYESNNESVEMDPNSKILGGHVTDA